MVGFISAMKNLVNKNTTIADNGIEKSFEDLLNALKEVPGEPGKIEKHHQAVFKKINSQQSKESLSIKIIKNHIEMIKHEIDASCMTQDEKSQLQPHIKEIKKCVNAYNFKPDKLNQAVEKLTEKVTTVAKEQHNKETHLPQSHPNLPPKPHKTQDQQKQSAHQLSSTIVKQTAKMVPEQKVADKQQNSASKPKIAPKSKMKPTLPSQPSEQPLATTDASNSKTPGKQKQIERLMQDQQLTTILNPSMANIHKTINSTKADNEFTLPVLARSNLVPSKQNQGRQQLKSTRPASLSPESSPGHVQRLTAQQEQDKKTCRS